MYGRKSDIAVKHTCSKYYYKEGIRNKNCLTHRDHVILVLLHDFPVQRPLCKVEAVSLIWKKDQLPHPEKSRFPVMKERRLSSA